MKLAFFVVALLAVCSTSSAQPDIVVQNTTTRTVGVVQNTQNTTTKEVGWTVCSAAVLPKFEAFEASFKPGSWDGIMTDNRTGKQYFVYQSVASLDIDSVEVATSTFGPSDELVSLRKLVATLDLNDGTLYEQEEKSSVVSRLSIQNYLEQELNPYTVICRQTQTPGVTVRESFYEHSDGRITCVTSKVKEEVPGIVMEVESLFTTEFQRLSSNYTKVRVASAPAGAKVFVNDSEWGATEKVGFLTENQPRFRLEMPGYKTFEVVETLATDKVNRFSYSLEQDSGAAK